MIPQDQKKYNNKEVKYLFTKKLLNIKAARLQNDAYFH
jgi:hypothetical protein